MHWPDNFESDRSILKDQTRGFARHAENALYELRTVTMAILSSIPGGNLTGTSLSKKLQIDKTLAWKIMKFIESSDILIGSQYIPGESSYRNFITKAEKSGANREYVERAGTAYKGFLRLMQKYTGDRASLDLMLMGISEEGCQKAFQEQKKSNFLSQRFLNGISASVHFSVHIHPKTDDSGFMKAVDVSGFTNLLRFRKSPCRMYSALRTLEEPGEADVTFIRKPLAIESAGKYTIPFFPEYCTCLMPQPQDTDVVPGLDDLLPDDIADIDNQINVVTADIIQFKGMDSSEVSDDVNQYYAMMSSRFPSEVLLFDLFLHRDMNFTKPEVKVYNDLEEIKDIPTRANRPDEYRFPFDEKITHMGRGAFCSQIREAAWYSEMIMDTFKKLGENDEEYDLYRVRIPYPYIPGTILLSFSSSAT